MNYASVNIRRKMTVLVKDNCGNGAGGFQSGNDCASGGSEDGPEVSGAIDEADKRVQSTFGPDAMIAAQTPSQGGFNNAYPGIGENVEVSLGVAYDSDVYSAKEFAENLADDAGSIGVIRSEGRGYGHLYTFKIGDQMMGAAELAVPGRLNRTLVFADEQGAIADDS